MTVPRAPRRSSFTHRLVPLARVLTTAIVAACSGGDDPVRPAPPGPTPDVRDTLSGAPTASAAEALPLRVPRVDTSDFRSDDPAVPGVPLSYRHAIVITTASATVGDVNATLRAHGMRVAGVVPGKAGVIGATLYLTLPTTTHAGATALLDTLRTVPWVRSATKDVLLQPLALPPRSANAPADWDYGANPAGGNWWLEAVRAPQLWNFNGRARKLTASVPTLVLDAGFNPAHPESNGVYIDQPVLFHTHGTAVATILGARFGDQSGLEGVNPFASLVLSAPADGGVVSFMVQAIAGLASTLLQRPDVRVVNLSLGYNWSQWKPPIDSDLNQGAQAVADEQGQVMEQMLGQLQAQGRPLPYILAAAGNDAQPGSTRVARYASPFCNAAERANGQAIMCVGAAQLQQGVVPYGRAGFSNSLAVISAPGAGMLVTDSLKGYVVGSGTSYASPLAAGVVGYLLALRPDIPPPTLTTNPIRAVLTATGRPATGLGPMVDAWAAAMSLDSAFGGNAVRLALVDIDDGTVDGNLRADSAGVATPNEDADGDGGEGDGVIDMSDFRRFRDAFLFVTQPNGLALDGPANSLKRDLNRDSVLEAAAQERVHARTDFNGDGILDEQTESLVPGLVQGPGPYTDLEVLQLQFSDPDVGVNELPVLLRSGDLHLRAKGCNVGGGLTLRTETQALSGGTVRIRPLVAGVTEQIVTVPVAIGASPATYVVRTLVTAPGDTATLTRVDTVAVALGGDTWLQTSCLAIKAAQLPQGTVGAVYSGQLSSVGETGPGTWALVGNGFPIGLTLNANGSITGTPTAAGTYNFSVRLTSGGTTVTRAFMLTVAGTIDVGGQYRGTHLQNPVNRRITHPQEVLDGLLRVDGDSLIGSFGDAFKSIGGKYGVGEVTMSFHMARVPGQNRFRGAHRLEGSYVDDQGRVSTCTGVFQGDFDVIDEPGKVRRLVGFFQGQASGELYDCYPGEQNRIYIELFQRPETPTADRSGVYLGYEEVVGNPNARLGVAVIVKRSDFGDFYMRDIGGNRRVGIDDEITGHYLLRPGSLTEFFSQFVVSPEYQVPRVVGSFGPMQLTYELRALYAETIRRFSGTR